MGKNSAIVAFICSLFFWVPLLGVLSSFTAVIVASIHLIKKEKKGKALAIAAWIIGTVGLLWSMNVMMTMIAFAQLS